MSTRIDDPADLGAPEPGEPSPPHDQTVNGSGGDGPGTDAAQPAKIAIGLLGFVLVAWFMWNACLSFAYYPDWYGNSKVLIGLLALVVGVGGAYFLFFFLNMLIEGLPGRVSRALMPYAFLAPGYALIGLMLLYPAVQTINYSFANADATEYVGLENYREVLGSDGFQSAILNNILWLVLVPAVTVFFGVIVAVLAD
ncbi:MAG TPA: hypothetical protein VHK88_08715, partial [Aquihabitans sp.]|nr:hypothetical protein [Aquihabitans sp.]